YQIIVDFSGKLYRSFQIDDQLFDLSNIPIYTHSSGIFRHLRSTIRIETLGAAAASLNLDEFLLHEI
ncbi:unnamed protein product, partial [marine sediment metagenome]